MKKRLITYATAAMLTLGTILTPTKAITNEHTQLYQRDYRVQFASNALQGTDYSKGWFYTLDQMEEIYNKEYEEGIKLDYYVRLENGKYIGTELEKEFEVPKEFIDKTLQQLERNLELGYAKYIFRLDAFHSHLLLPDDMAKEFYNKYRGVDYTKNAIKSEKLGALYHNAEHLALRDPPKIGPIDLEAQDLISKRSVLGWYDGRDLEQTHPDENDPIAIQKANSAGPPKGYKNAANLTFKAHKNGEFSIFHDGKEIKVDLSFDANGYY